MAKENQNEEEKKLKVSPGPEAGPDKTEQAPKSDDKRPADAEAAAPPVNPLDAIGDADDAAVKTRKTKSSRNVFSGIVYIQATFNNTLVSVTDMSGAVIAWSNGGRMGFKGTRKSTAYAATMIAQDAARQAISHGMREVEIRVQGPGSGRESAIRAVQAAGLNISVISDITPVPHNGCRPRKRRRV